MSKKGREVFNSRITNIFKKTIGKSGHLSLESIVNSQSRRRMNLNMTPASTMELVESKTKNNQ